MLLDSAKIISIDFINLAIFLLVVYLATQILKKALFLIYVAQLKEYRIDRLKVWLQTKTGKKELINHFNLLKWKKTIFPKITIRSLLIFFITIVGHYNLFFLLLRLAFKVFKGFSWNIFVSVVITIFLINVLTPLVIVIATVVTQWLAYPIKQAIFSLAESKMKRFRNLTVIGVTGSYGKTAVKEILYHLLKDSFISLKTPYNCNTLTGIAMVVLSKLKAKHQVLIVEMGAYQKGEIKEICEMVKPKIGIITGISSQHLSLFGSIANIQWGKYELIKSLPKDGLAVFNGKSEYMKRMIQVTKIRKKVYGRSRKKYQTKLIGDWHQENIQAAMVIAEWLGVGKKDLLKRFVKKNQKP
jgi:UDP-N-acetylmuramoyl-tripeptide--D-alanyl-D-alanine ligase